MVLVMQLWFLYLQFSIVISLQPRIYCTYSKRHLDSFKSDRISYLVCIQARSFFSTRCKDLIEGLAFCVLVFLAGSHELERDLFQLCQLTEIHKVHGMHFSLKTHFYRCNISVFRLSTRSRTNLLNHKITHLLILLVLLVCSFLGPNEMITVF